MALINLLIHHSIGFSGAELALLFQMHPDWFALLNETAHAFLSIGLCNVVNHFLLAVFVRRFQCHLVLFVEEPFAALNNRSTLRFDAVTNTIHFFIQRRLVWHDPSD